MADKTMTQREFAKHMGWADSYVTKLKNAGRLVFDGKRVKVNESIALIDQTAGSRDDVAARHKAARISHDQPEVDVVIPDVTLKDAQRIKALAESRRVAALADKEEMERDRLAGDLIAREDVDAAMKFIGATVRGLLDVFPDQVSPVIAPVTSMDECHALLTEQCRNVLVGLGDAIERQRASLGGVTG